jgi:hypothetical protein
MATRLNNAHVNASATAIRNAYAGGTLEIRTGSQPASANAAASGTLLCTINLPNPAFSAPVNGVLTKTGTWSGTAIASGIAGWARFIGTGGEHIDAAIGSDLTIDNANVVDGGTVTVNTYTHTQPLT